MSHVRNRISISLLGLVRGLEPPELEREEGQTLVEYALIILGVAIVCVAIVGTIGGQISSVFSHIADAI